MLERIADWTRKFACRWMSQRQQQLSNRKCSKSAHRSANIKNILFWWKICSVDSDMFSSLSPPWTQSLLNNPESSFQAAFKLLYNLCTFPFINQWILKPFSKITNISPIVIIDLIKKKKVFCLSKKLSLWNIRLNTIK